MKLFSDVRWLFFNVCLAYTCSIFPATQPNIILFIADDMTWFDAGCYGSADVKTPHLDKLASQGMRFLNCSTSTAMCAPTRQQLYTGLWPVRSGAYPNHSAVKDGTRSLGHHFVERGYRVAIAGKKHYKPAKSYPFETLPGGAAHDNGKRKDSDFDLGTVREFINRDANQPYFLICATNQPHAPWNRGDASQYDPAKLSLPPNIVDTPVTRQEIAKYYAEITYADQLLGGVMDALEAAKQTENTILLFTSEQGSQLPFAKWTCYEAGLKTALVVRWPGKIKPNTTTEAMVQYVDIVPTLLAAVGAEPEKIDTGRDGAADAGRGFDGKSFLHVLLGQGDQHRRLVFGIHTTRGIINGSNCYPIRSVRNERYKLIHNLSSENVFKNILMLNNPVWNSWIEAAASGDAHAKAMVQRYRIRPEIELYDLHNDPHEMNNLADRKELYPTIMALRASLETWMTQQGDEGVTTELRAKAR
jgi:uncharacterized sulfatase